MKKFQMSTGQVLADEMLLKLKFSDLESWELADIDALSDYVYDKLHTLQKDIMKWHNIHDMLCGDVSFSEQNAEESGKYLPSGDPWPSDEELLKCSAIEMDCRPLGDLSALMCYIEQEKSKDETWQKVLDVLYQASFNQVSFG